jgi:hypothetical protein
MPRLLQVRFRHRMLRSGSGRSPLAGLSLVTCLGWGASASHESSPQSVTSISVALTDAQSDPDGEQPPVGAVRPPLLEWQEQLRASPGFRAIALQTQVKRMGDLFQGNVAQYKSLVVKLQDPSVSLPVLDVRNPGAYDALLDEAERLLHNVLTAMSTRVDQQRRFMSKHFSDDPVLTTEYSEKVTSLFTPSLEAAFLKGLRNYITHLQLPVHQSKHTFTQQSFEITFILPGKPLLTWDGWNSSLRAWITSQGEAVPIVDVVDTYARITGDFDRWLHGRIGLKFKSEIETFLREQERYTREVNRVFGA